MDLVREGVGVGRGGSSDGIVELVSVTHDRVAIDQCPRGSVTSCLADLALDHAEHIETQAAVVRSSGVSASERGRRRITLMTTYLCIETAGEK